MRIKHHESGNVYEIVEDKGLFKLPDLKIDHAYTFKEAYEAVWAAIEIIRNISFNSLSDDDLFVIAKRAHITVSSPLKSIKSLIKKERIIRTYYDQIFLIILSHYRSERESIVVSNKTNFNIDHEITFLMRKSEGVSLSIPDYKF